MAVLKCKMCGGDLNITEGMTVCECEFCGTKQTVPTADNEKKMTLFARANRLRQGNEFDKASGIYESIVSEFPEEAEAYWGIVLCRYGIEYVDDPLTGKKVPTCHRSSFDSVMDDPDFDQALENADAVARKVYRDEAKQIEEIRKGIIEVSGKEAPYDIFICYKETDENGDRTIDSVIAQDVYDALTDRGYRVFFSRISLEDKLGTEYEPYIFAALNSAKIMLAFGTDYEYYNAVWVKNEWSRYLRLMAADKTKHLIPCYKGIDAYDIPKEFAKLQAQDMGKVGAIQDLVRGIGKILGRGEAPAAQSAMAQQAVSGDGKSYNALMIRGINSLEDGAFDEASKYFDQILNMDATSAEAYLGLFMANLKKRNRSSARETFINGMYLDDRNWKRARQYATGALSSELQEWEETIRRKKEVTKLVQYLRLFRNARAEGERRERFLAETAPLRALLESEAFEPDAAYFERKKALDTETEKAEKAYLAEKEKLEKIQEDTEINHIQKELQAKKQEVVSLGLFKRREKEFLIEQITDLEKRIRNRQREIQTQQEVVSEKEKKLEEKRKKAADYELVWKKERRESIQERLEIVTVLFEEKDTIRFGRYQQNHDIQPIEWKILEKENGKALLISKYALDCRPYHVFHSSTSWEKCMLRKWLNTNFLEKAFTSKEQSMIQSTVTSVSSGKSISDQVFLLSDEEAMLYFDSDSTRQCQLTNYARVQGASTDGSYCWWWLRSPGIDLNRAQFVSPNGSVNSYGTYVSASNYVVRPAMWIDLWAADALT